MIRHLLKICLLAFTLLLLTDGALAASAIGHVVWVKGTLLSNGNSVGRNANIFQNDTLTTNSSSQAGIVFTDSSLITLKEGTTYAVNSYSYNPRAGTGNFAASMTSGGFRTVTGMIAKNQPQNYETNTPVATIGVRGTDYQAVLSGGALYVDVIDGTVCFGTTGGVDTDFLNWMSNPAVYLPQVAAVPDNRPNCAGLTPAFIGPNPVIPTLGALDPPVTVEMAPLFTTAGGPLIFSATGTPLTSQDIVSINPVTGTLTIYNSDTASPVADTIYPVTITVSASSACATATTTFQVIFDKSTA